MRPPEERRRVPLDLEREPLELDRERVPLDFDRDEAALFARDEPLPFERDEPELFDRDEPPLFDRDELLDLERDAVLFFLPVAFLAELLLPPERDFFAAPPLERDFAAVLLPERERPELEPPGAVAGRGVGVAAGALAETTVVGAAVVRPPGTLTSGSKPSSRKAIQAPTAIPAAAIRPRNIPILRSPGLARIRQRISSTARLPSTKVPAPRWNGRLIRCPAAASPPRATPETAASAIRKPEKS